MQYRPLGNTGLGVSVLSFGASSLGGAFRDVSEAEGIRTVHETLDRGVNFIDVSPFYGLTKAETVLGKALRGISRDRFYLATKVGRYGNADFDFSAERVIRSVDESLQRLGVDTIDLIQTHDIEFGDLQQVINETLPALHRLKEKGKVRHVGITGLPMKVFTTVIGQTPPGVVETILSYCRYELNDTSLAAILPAMKARSIGVISAAPTGMGLLTERGTPDWHPAPAKVRELCQKAAQHCRARGFDIVELAVQFSIAQPDIATTMIGSASPENMRRNIDYASRPLDPEKLREVQAILAPIHNTNWPSGRPENCDPIVGS
jgi:L-galactose dehydrogenase